MLVSTGTVAKLLSRVQGRTWLLPSRCEGADDGRAAVRSITSSLCIAGTLPADPGQISVCRACPYGPSLLNTEAPVQADVGLMFRLKNQLATCTLQDGKTK